MALSFTSVKKTYEIFNQLRNEGLINLNIKSWPSDMQDWPTSKKENPPLNEVLGWDKKSDDGWENICFFVQDPSQELIERFKELAVKIHNTSMCNEYKRNKNIWIFGWF